MPSNINIQNLRLAMVVWAYLLGPNHRIYFQLLLSYWLISLD